MKELYYPGFEVKSQEWLKYALLYKERVLTIVPYEVEDYWLSDQYHYLSNATDFLEKCSPSYEVSERTSRDVICVVEDVLRYPGRYFSLTRTGNIVNQQNKWRQKKEFELFRGKYSWSFSEQLKELELAEPFNEGIRIHKEIGLIYMAQLAKNIAHEGRYNLTTDNIEYKTIHNIFKDLWDENNNMKYSKASEILINEYLPCDIKDISLKHVVEVRNRRDYMELIKVHNRTIKMFVDNLEEGEHFNLEKYMHELKMINKEMLGIMAGILGAGATMVTTVMTNDIDPELAQAINSAVGVNNLALAFGGIKTNKNEYSLGERYKARRFISNIKKLKKIN